MPLVLPGQPLRPRRRQRWRTPPPANPRGPPSVGKPCAARHWRRDETKGDAREAFLFGIGTDTQVFAYNLSNLWQNVPHPVSICQQRNTNAFAPQWCCRICACTLFQHPCRSGQTPRHFWTPSGEGASQNSIAESSTPNTRDASIAAGGHPMVLAGAQAAPGMYRIYQPSH